MWNSSVTREHLLQKISLLAILESVRDHPKRHALISPPGWRSSLTIEQEQEIVSNLAFLSSRSKNSKRVVAISIEEDHDGQGMVIRMAVNGGDKDIPYIEEGLKQIKQPEAENTSMLLRLIVSGDFPRIYKRLKLGTKYDVATSHITLLHRTLCNCSNLNNENQQMEALREMSKTLLDLFQQLKESPLPQKNPVAYEITEQIVMQAHSLNQSPGFTIALTTSSELDPKQRVALEDTVRKLGQYYKASSELVLAARRRKCRIFQKVRVERFQTIVLDDIKKPSMSGSALPLIKHLLDLPATSELLGRFHGSESFADAAILRRLNNSRSGVKVHAEIKLLFFYETHPEIRRPRVICASKSACYLCDLFIRLHGEFQTLGTFGKFNERWVLPDWLDTVPSNRFQPLGHTVEQFSKILDSEIGLALKSSKRLSDPLESTVGLSAQWSDSTVDSGLCTGTFPVQCGLVSSIAKSKLDSNPSKPNSLPSSSYPNLVATPTSALTLNSTRFWQHIKLSHGKDAWARLPEKEISFTVEFHDFIHTLQVVDLDGEIACQKTEREEHNAEPGEESGVSGQPDCSFGILSSQEAIILDTKSANKLIRM
ncbi:hypothetical protein N431DRAFT_482672 [Stipitochalara longipes BDJ]|nr:hypothetical protein N431DRAFT_482672 [Stipitochalara longipes BDJ]